MGACDEKDIRHLPALVAHMVGKNALLLDGANYWRMAHSALPEEKEG